MIETRLKLIFDYLTSDYNYHTSEEIGKDLQLSDKTIQREIHILNTYIEDNGAKIKSLKGYGYKFIITDENAFKKFLKDDWYKHAYFVYDNADKEGRIESILHLFLFSNSYIKQQEIADSFYISLSQTQKDISYIKKVLKKYDLTLQSKPYYGMKVSGSERNIRKAIKNEIGMDPSIYKDNEDIKLFGKIQEIIDQIDFGPNFYMPYVNFKNLVIHIYISILRIRDDRIVENSKDLDNKLISYEEFNIASIIVENLKEKLDMAIPYQELVYLTMHLIAKNTVSDHGKMSNEVTSVAQEIIDIIYEVTKYDFRANIDFYFSLSTHLGPLIERIKYGLDMKNPLLEDIKANQIAFFIATIGSNVINERYKTKISDDEIGYLALHVISAMENNDQNKKDILLVCGSGNSSAQVMKSQLISKFSKQINKLVLIDYSKIDNYDLESFDFIVSSINLKLQTSTPIVYVDILFKQKDFINIDKAMKGGGSREIYKIFSNSILIRDIDVYSREDAIEILAEIAAKKTNMAKEEIISQYKKREKLSSTALADDIAIPHIFKQVKDESFSIILIPNKEILWEDKKVSIIYSLFVGSEIGDMSLYYEKLGDFLINDKVKEKAIKAQNNIEFMEIFLKGENYG